VSRLRRMLRSVIPVGLLEVYRQRARPGTIWQGVYPTINEVPVQGTSLSGESWLEHTGPRVRALLSAHESSGPIPSDAEITSEHRTFLAIAGLLAKLQGSLCVLDLGGGLGASYVYLVNSLPAESRIEYHIVELPRICEEGSRIFKDYPGIQFHSSLPADRIVPDIVYSNGALQFMPDYRGAIETLAGYGAAFILLADLPADDIPTFASVQTNVGAGVPVWFFNLQEIVKMVVERGYSQVLDGKTRLADDQRNFPREFRQTNDHTLLFCSETWLRRANSSVGRANSP
jgi:putative methyltransferase (TIGR04325 family)